MFFLKKKRTPIIVLTLFVTISVFALSVVYINSVPEVHAQQSIKPGKWVDTRIVPPVPIVVYNNCGEHHDCGCGICIAAR
jgi:hypothetical protein